MNCIEENVIIELPALLQIIYEIEGRWRIVIDNKLRGKKNPIILSPIYFHANYTKCINHIKEIPKLLI